mmetsp:Transcript_23609/g.50528  ORF Transcript_23609/g.50528 Transcript_23609/m.50528 type:complete len:304 (-) Transcript_23609:562-1473(-)
MATTTSTPNFFAFSMCLTRLPHPADTSGTFSSVYSDARGFPAETGGPPPCILRARTVATMTAHLGLRPDSRHLMLKNFSIPISAPKPASVTTYPSSPTSFSANLSATMLELPIAMFANGPAWTSTGVLSTVCISVGKSASFINTVSAPPHPRSSAVIGSPAFEYPTTMLPNFSRRSGRSFARARTAIISEATVMSNPVSRECWTRGVSPLTVPRGWIVSLRPFPMVTSLKWRSHVSSTLCHVMVDLSKSNRANFDRSSGVNSSGDFSGSMLNLTSLLFIIGGNGFPFAKQSLLYRASSDCESS